MIKIGKFHIPLPASLLVRLLLGGILVLGGLLFFLPIFGLWMMPLGLLILSYDLPKVRRWRRQVEVSWGRWRQRRNSIK